MEKSLNILLIALVALSLIFSVSMALSPKLKASDVEGIVDSKISELSFPTAQEIASLIEVPEVELPTASSDSIENDKVEDIFEKLYSDEIENLTEEAKIAFDAEFDEEELEEFLEEAIEGFDVLKDIEADEDSLEVTIKNLGLEDAEDKLVEVTQEFKIKYELDDDYDRLKGVVIAKGIVTFDEEDGFEVEIEFSLK